MKLYMQHNIGHRERARGRLIDSKPGVMQDYEILEILLFMAVPRKDTKDLAKILINKYGSFAKVINAEYESLLEVRGVGENVLACFHLIKEGVVRLTREEIIDKPIISSWQSLLDYCRAVMGHLKKEAFLIIYLNNQNELIDEDLQEYGTVDQVSVYPREITKRALFLNASAIIMVHNHPGGNTKASKEDIEVTQQIANALSPFKIKIHDHIIISDKSFFSFKSEGLF
jgi:DNA repair protein RadC